MSHQGFSPSRRSLFALDALCLILADVKGGLGPFVAVYLASSRQWDAGRVGLAMALMGVAELVGQTPAGALVDATRRKRGVLWLGFLGVAVGALTLVASGATAAVLVALAAVGAAGSVFGPALAAVSLGMVGRDGLSRRLGRNQAFDHAGNVAAAVLAGVLGETLGYPAIFLGAAATCAAGAAVTGLIRESDIDHRAARGDDVGPSSDGLASAPAGWGVLLTDPRLLGFAAAVVLFHAANAAMLPLVGQKLAAGSGRGAAGALASAVVAAQLVMIPVALLASRLAETRGRKPALLIAFAVLPVRGVLSALGSSPAALVAVQLLDGVAAGIIGVVGVLVVADLTRGTGRFNLMQGAVATATGLGAALSQAGAGAVVRAAGYDSGFLALAAVAACALVVLAVAVPETGPVSSRPPSRRRGLSPAPLVPTR